MLKCKEKMSKVTEWDFEENDQKFGGLIQIIPASKSEMCQKYDILK